MPRVHRCAGRSEVSLPPRVGPEHVERPSDAAFPTSAGRKAGILEEVGCGPLILAISLGASSRCGGMRKRGRRGRSGRSKALSFLVQPVQLSEEAQRGLVICPRSHSGDWTALAWGQCPFSVQPGRLNEYSASEVASKWGSAKRSSSVVFLVELSLPLASQPGAHAQGRVQVCTPEALTLPLGQDSSPPRPDEPSDSSPGHSPFPSPGAWRSAPCLPQGP